MASAATDHRNSLDSPNYNPVGHLNAIFSHPSTLSSLSQVSTALHDYQDDLDTDITSRVAAQLASDDASVARIQAAKASLTDLFKRIEGVQRRAEETERSIAEMTADIKRLDNTKRNLTLSMTALKRLQMLTMAYEQLRGLVKTRQYRECAQLLQAVLQLVAHFRSYRSVEQIAVLSRNVGELQRELLEQVCEDFEVVFAKGDVGTRKGMLREGAEVIEALGEEAKRRLVNWYCNNMLREYRRVFGGSDEAGSLDNIARRYSWFNRMIKTYDLEHASIFPPHWRVGESLANAFCEGTRDDFKGILQRSMRRTDGQTLDVNLLLSCLQETLNFEHSLDQRFSTESRSSMDTITSGQERPHSLQSISEAFEPCMTLWVDSQDKQLAALTSKYRQQPLRNPEEEFSSQAVISSATELFHFYRLALAQCQKLSTGTRLLELSKTFGKYLDSYGQQVLFYYLSERAGPQGPSLEDIVMILNTADYCYTTCNQLEEKIKARIDEDVREQVDLQNQADAFMGIASAAVRALVKKVEMEIDPIWKEMRNMPWGTLESVGDSSTYISEFLRILRLKSSEILRYLHKPVYARTFCDNLVDGMATLYVANIGICKPVSEVGAEQMLLDYYALKEGLLKIPNVNADEGAPPPPAAYIKRATHSLAKIETLLKPLQVRPSPPEALVQAYLIHIGDRSEANFRKILDLKGTLRKDQPTLVDIFNAHSGAPNYANLPASSALVSNLQITEGKHPTSGLASLRDATGTPSLAGGRFDPSTFGTAIMNAAREGVDRFGSPALGTSGRRSLDEAVPGQHTDGVQHTAATNLNENLKNIGKFFRRDTGGFRGFGSKS